MFTINNIVYNNSGCIRSLTHTKYNNSKKALFNIISKAIQELSLASDISVEINDSILNDGNLGAMQFDSINKSAKFIFSYTTFKNISFNPTLDIEEFYTDSLATVWHEIYHLHDCEKRLQLYLKFGFLTPGEQELYTAGCKFWSEYYAVYQTKKYCEQEHIYDSFAQSIENLEQYDKNKVSFMYNLSRVLGYYAHDKHDDQCDRLLNEFQITPELTNIIVLLKRIFDCFHDNISVETFIELGERVNLLDNTHPKLKPFSLENYAPISLESLFGVN